MQARTAPGELHNAGIAHVASTIEAERFQRAARADCCEGGIRKLRRDERERGQIWRSLCDSGDVVIGEQQPESQVTQAHEGGEIHGDRLCRHLVFVKRPPLSLFIEAVDSVRFEAHALE